MTYQIIADSGSTKTDWVLVKENKVLKEISTQGLNPYQLSFNELVSILQEDVWPVFQTEVLHLTQLSIFFYGAGCGSEEKQKVVKEALELVIPAQTIEVFDDMLGAARALCGKNIGIACILGTGSNSCCYDGNRIVDNRPAPGYVLGDEGGGAHLGKLLLIDFINDEMPAGLKEMMKLEFSLSNEIIYENVYKRNFPNRYLASFAVFIKQEINGEFGSYLEQLVLNNFQIFFNKHIKKYDKKWGATLHTIGSVGYHFEKEFLEIAQQNGYRVGTKLKSPIKGLVLYHSS